MRRIKPNAILASMAFLFAILACNSCCVFENCYKSKKESTTSDKKIISNHRYNTPKRYFGPIYGNSPDIRLSGTSIGMVYNNYLINHPKKNIFKLYYGNNLPSNIESLPNSEPGAYPSSGFGDVNMSFDKLTFSSKYGGSFLLHFLSKEDYQMEFRHGDYLWDIDLIKMNIYVKPYANLLNPPMQIVSYSWKDIHIELIPKGITGYIINEDEIEIINKKEAIDTLTKYLPEVTNQLINHGSAQFAKQIACFSHGLAHIEQFEDIAITDKVTAIEVSDNFFFPRTERARPYAALLARIMNIQLDTEDGEEEIEVSIATEHHFKRTDTVSVIIKLYMGEFDEGESTPWETIAIYPLDDKGFNCDTLENIIYLVKIQENDLVLHDRFFTDPSAYQLGGSFDCDGMRRAFNRGDFGFYRNEGEHHFDILDKNDKYVGNLDVQFKSVVIKH